MNFRTGRLDPSYAAIAAKAGVCVRTVASALQRLKALGILNWVRRCAERWADGHFVLEQETNAYAVLPEIQWRGYRPPQEPPTPAAGTWGEPPPSGRSGGAGARSGGQGAGTGQRSEGRPGSRPGAARASVHGAQCLILPECTRRGETFPKDKSHWQQTIRTGRSKEARRIEQEADGRACASAGRHSGSTCGSRKRYYRLI